MEQELEAAQAYLESNNYDSAFAILHKLGNITLLVLHVNPSIH